MDSSSSDEFSSLILRRVDKWACVKNCGACCKLGPLDSRPDLETYLTGYYNSKYYDVIVYVIFSLIYSI